MNSRRLIDFPKAHDAAVAQALVGLGGWPMSQLGIE
jgi:hypothetical protein